MLGLRSILRTFRSLNIQENRFLLLFSVLLFAYSCAENGKNSSSKLRTISVSDDLIELYIVDNDTVKVFDDKISIEHQGKHTILNNFYIKCTFINKEKKRLFLGKKSESRIYYYDLKNGVLSKTNITTCSFSAVSKNYLLCADSSLKIYETNTNKLELKHIEQFKEELFDILTFPYSDKVIIQTGYFPSGGCEKLNFFITEIPVMKFRKVQGVSEKYFWSPIDYFSHDQTGQRIFLPSYQLVNNINTYLYDVIIDNDFNEIGKALPKNEYRIGEKYENGIFQSYIWKVSDERVIFYPQKSDLEIAIYNLYKEIPLKKIELTGFSKLELDLLTGVLMRKHKRLVDNTYINDVLSLYKVFGPGTIADKQAIASFSEIDMRNFKLLKSIMKSK